MVVKADGLALGKGVVVARSREEAEQAVRESMENHKFGKSGEKLVIEEFLEGPEVSPFLYRRQDHRPHGLLHGPQVRL